MFALDEAAVKKMAMRVKRYDIVIIGEQKKALEGEMPLPLPGYVFIFMSKLPRLPPKKKEKEQIESVSKEVHVFITVAGVTVGSVQRPKYTPRN